MNVVVAQLNHGKREKLCSALRARGLQVFSVPDVPGLVESASQARLSVALVDPKLLAKEKEDLRAQIQRRAGYAIAVVALTNQTEESLRAPLARHGAMLLGRAPEDTAGVAEWVVGLSEVRSAVSAEGQVEPGRHWSGAAPVPIAGPGAELGHDGKGPTILVVEDEQTFRSFLCEALGEKDYKVYAAENGAGALKFLEQNHADLVISDINMPEMDGFELKQKVDLWKQRPIPFIMMTADSSGERADDASAVGVVFILAKPIRNLEALYVIVAEALRKNGVAVPA